MTLGSRRTLGAAIAGASRHPIAGAETLSCARLGSRSAESTDAFRCARRGLSLPCGPPDRAARQPWALANRQGGGGGDSRDIDFPPGTLNAEKTREGRQPHRA
jgi:hypothetical protein